MEVSGNSAIEPLRDAVLIAGPTASGKSALALDIARETGGTVVNADSMQVYSVLDVLTARPRAADLAAAPHLLYGHRHPGEAYSTGTWAGEVEHLIRSQALRGRPAVFVGGTGLYFRALLDGLSWMPPVSASVRKKWRAALDEEGAAALHRLLGSRDPEGAATIAATDGQRIVRALEVLESSGRPIHAWRGGVRRPLVEAASARLIVIEPDRAELAERIGRRFDAMLAGGAMEEAKALAALGIDPAMPAMKAIGVRELLAADAGEVSLAEARERATAATRQYAKRQSTWFRHQLGEGWTRIRAGRAKP